MAATSPSSCCDENPHHVFAPDEGHRDRHCERSEAIQNPRGDGLDCVGVPRNDSQIDPTGKSGRRNCSTSDRRTASLTRHAHESIARENLFHEHLQSDRASGHLTLKFSISFFRKSCYYSPQLLLSPSRLTRGAFRDRHERGGGMRWAHRIAAWVCPAPTNDPVRTAKPCGPGIPVLMPSLRCDERAGDGGKKAGPRGERGGRC
jgi:hypothetical protein